MGYPELDRLKMLYKYSDFPQYDVTNLSGQDSYVLDHAVGIAALMNEEVDAILMVWSDIISTQFLS